MLQLCINVFTGSNFKYVKNVMNVTERHGCDLQVPKFHACSINGSIFIEFLNKLCSGVKFTFRAHMKQIPLSKVLFHCCNLLSIQISNVSYSPRIVWHQNKSVIPTKEHSNHYLQNVQYTIDLVISGIME
jgi:hypothetical protein